MDIFNSVVHVGIDGGQGSLKIVMNMFDPSVLDFQPKNQNKYLISFIFYILSKQYLKLFSIIKGHDGKYLCCYCDGPMDEKEVLRTFGSLADEFKKYQFDNKPRIQMQYCKNVIYPCLLDEKLTEEIINIIPPPDYHIYEHHVSKIIDILFTYKSLKEFLEKKTIIRHGYNGGGFDGPNCAKVSSSLDEMTLYSPIEYLECIETIRRFKEVAECCFGMKLDISYKEKIDKFVESVLHLKVYVYDVFAMKISLGWKFHIIRFHLKEYLERQKILLGITSEQTSEAVHKNLNKTLKRFVLSEKNVHYSEKLRAIVVEYS
ncbi:uncharacterized protein LOC136090196 [Hydra vulgaris]|uniref:Uncharacterized protein LOC136090196 n=1 Tax=Hydra vulgaris TaxID=6087 RepID=A0ABM4DDI2_HYDVU